MFVVCAKLHNLCIYGGFGFDGEVQIVPDNAPPFLGEIDLNAQRARTALIARF